MRLHRPRPHRFATLLVALPLLGIGPCADDFDLGVAAFEVGERSAILWTHAVPANPDRAAALLWVQVATDPDFEHIIRHRAVAARRSHDFTARARIRGLRPATRYHYRFGSGWGPMAATSPAGSFRTRPVATDGAPTRFVVSGDSNIGYTSRNGFDFHVLSAAAAEDPDFFVYFGDTIYADSGVLPGGASAVTLDEYRQVHKLTRADPALQQLLASTATFTGWDDHEVVNDYDGATVDPTRQANGYQAFFEYLPVRARPTPGPFRIDRNVRWGRHVELFFLDGRQFRDPPRFCNAEPTPDGPETADTLFSPFVEDELLAAAVDPALGPLAAAILLTPSDPDCVDGLLADPGRSHLGAGQLAALKQALLESTATFKIIVNNVPLMSLLVTPYDRWEGYLAERQELLDFIGAHLDPSRTLVLTTDFHTNLAVRRDELTELVVGPIGQTTFATSVGQIVGPQLQPFLPVILDLFDGVVDEANGGTDPASLERVLGVEHDAFSYAVVDVFEEAGAPRLRVTLRGNRSYALGSNDPADVEDLFSFEMP